MKEIFDQKYSEDVYMMKNGLYDLMENMHDWHVYI